MHHHTVLSLAVSLSLALTTTAIPGQSPPSSHRRADTDTGVDLTNMGSEKQTFYFCNNKSNDPIDPGFPCEVLVTSVEVAPSATATVSLGPTFTGRVVRSTETPATWVEVRIMPEGTAWGDITLQVGCDGAAEVGPTTGFAEVVGFKEDIVADAPEDITETRADGVKVISIPWSEGKITNAAAADYLLQKVGNDEAYITTLDATKVTNSANNRLQVWFY